jgi:XTP/dITP diphosphohydrolase
MKQLLVATNNQGKVAEFAEMLSDMQITWLGLADVGIETDVAETEDTFRGNAILKGKSYAQMSGLLTLADDSGLEVDALGGAPGVYTARYGGEGLSREERYNLVLQQLTGVPAVQRTARFRCVLVVVGVDGRILAEAEGVCEGTIAFAPIGQGGFGYDPIFYLPEKGQTMAQLDSAEKHQISHRGQAVRKIEPLLRTILAERL